MSPTGTPSTMYNGFEFPIVPKPRIVTLVPAPGDPLFWVILTPAVTPCKAAIAVDVFSAAISSPFTFTLAPVTKAFF